MPSINRKCKQNAYMQTSQDLPIQQPEIRFTDINITQSMPLVSTWHDSVVTLVLYIVEWKTLMLVCWFSNICLKLLEFLYRGFGQADKTLFFHDIICMLPRQIAIYPKRKNPQIHSLRNDGLSCRLVKVHDCITSGVNLGRFWLQTMKLSFTMTYTAILHYIAIFVFGTTLLCWIFFSGIVVRVTQVCLHNFYYEAIYFLLFSLCGCSPNAQRNIWSKIVPSSEMKGWKASFGVMINAKGSKIIFMPFWLPSLKTTLKALKWVAQIFTTSSKA